MGSRFSIKLWTASVTIRSVSAASVTGLPSRCTLRPPRPSIPSSSLASAPTSAGFPASSSPTSSVSRMSAPTAEPIAGAASRGRSAAFALARAIARFSRRAASCPAVVPPSGSIGCA